VEAVLGFLLRALNLVLNTAKTRRFRGRPGERSDRKKAYVTLEEGNTIDVATGL
jgi:large subunit ribosomal protein L23